MKALFGQGFAARGTIVIEVLGSQGIFGVPINFYHGHGFLGFLWLHAPIAKLNLH